MGDPYGDHAMAESAGVTAKEQLQNRVYKIAEPEILRQPGIFDRMDADFGVIVKEDRYGQYISKNSGYSS